MKNNSNKFKEINSVIINSALAEYILNNNHEFDPNIDYTILFAHDNYHNFIMLEQLDITQT